MPRHLQRHGSGKKALVIVLAIVGFFGMLMIALCAGCGIWMFKSFTRDIPPAQAAANAFLDDLKADRIDAAYNSASTAFKSAQSLDQFREFVKKFETFKTHASRSFDYNQINQTTSGKRATFKLTLTSPNNAMSCTMVVFEENAVWKVERVSVP